MITGNSGWNSTNGSWNTKTQKPLCSKLSGPARNTFVSIKNPTEKNYGFWSACNPNEIIKCSDKNDLKVMISADITDSKVVVIHFFINENGRCESMNGNCYLEWLQETIFPSFRSFCNQKRFEVGAKLCSCPLHNCRQEIPLEKVSRQSDHPWD